jgi:outer membrane lipoprotein-sorting protein
MRRNRAPSSRSRCRWALLGLAWLLAGAPAIGADLEPPPEGLDAHAIAQRAEDALRGERTILDAKVIIDSSRHSDPREVRFRSFDDRLGGCTFIRVLSPAKVEGTGFLKLHPNLWVYEPRDERLLRIPPSMMREPWMGSDFTQDDLVNESSEVDDYDQRLLGIDPKPDGIADLRAYVVEYVPHEDAPIVWGKIIAWIETEHGTPLRQEFYDGDGELRRVVHFGGIREVQGRYFPHVWVVRPAGGKERETRLEVEAVRFDVDFDESVFDPRHLRSTK